MYVVAIGQKLPHLKQNRIPSLAKQGMDQKGIESNPYTFRVLMGSATTPFTKGVQPHPKMENSTGRKAQAQETLQNHKVLKYFMEKRSSVIFALFM